MKKHRYIYREEKNRVMLKHEMTVKRFRNEGFK